MSGLCAYKDIFGKPGEGGHSYRILNIAVVDVALTVLAAKIISIYYKGMTFTQITIALFVIAIILHYAFCVNTTVNRVLFGVQ